MIPVTAPVDRRVRRSRRALQNALVELVLEQGFSDVTIEDITERADVSRATFYAHYADKRSLLDATVEELWQDLVASADPVMPNIDPMLTGAALAVLFRHVQAHQGVYRVIVGGACDGLPLRTFHQRLAARLRLLLDTRTASLGLTPRLPHDFLARTLAAELLTVVAWWLDSPEEHSPAELALMVLQRMVYGDAWAQGFEPGEMQLDEARVRAALSN